jgi:hypothetical protein
MGRPLIGIAQTWSGEAGVWQAGGWPMEFPTISLRR